MRAIVDTNVMVVANRKAEQASPDCVIESVRHLEALKSSGKIVVDNAWRVIKEYQANINSSGEPGAGDRFLRWVLSNRSNLDRCESYSITPDEANPDNFMEFPADPNLLGFHMKDRKFVALAVVSKAPVWEAVDEDWWQYRKVLQANNISVEFLCPDHFKSD